MPASCRHDPALRRILLEDIAYPDKEQTVFLLNAVRALIEYGSSATPAVIPSDLRL
jgi:hypothetical protein